MIYAVTVEPLNSIFFLAEAPEGDGWDVQEGVSLDIPSNYDAWPEGAECPEQVLCTSTSDPKHYKLFKYAKDIDRGEFRPTGRNFGGVYSHSSWERFVKHLPATLAVLEIPDSVPAGTSAESTGPTDQES